MGDTPGRVRSADPVSVSVCGGRNLFEYAGAAVAGRVDSPCYGEL
jgi:hypothetical protein